jgi:hypothetical protein
MTACRVPPVACYSVRHGYVLFLSLHVDASLYMLVALRNIVRGMSISLGTHHMNVRLTIRLTWVSDQMNMLSRSCSSKPSFNVSLTSLAGSRITPNSLAYVERRRAIAIKEAIWKRYVLVYAQ